MSVLAFAVQTSVEFYHTSVQKKRMSGHIARTQVAGGRLQVAELQRATCNLQPATWFFFTTYSTKS